MAARRPEDSTLRPPVPVRGLQSRRRLSVPVPLLQLPELQARNRRPIRGGRANRAVDGDQGGSEFEKLGQSVSDDGESDDVVHRGSA